MDVLLSAPCVCVHTCMLPSGITAVDDELGGSFQVLLAWRNSVKSEGL